MQASAIKARQRYSREQRTEKTKTEKTRYDRGKQTCQQRIVVQHMKKENVLWCVKSFRP